MKNKKQFIMNILSATSIGLMAYSYVPQLWLTYSTKNVEGQSLQFWVLLALSLLLINIIQIDLLKGSEEKKYGALVFQALNLILAVAMLVGVVIFS